MFKDFKRSIEFRVTKDKDLLFAYIKGRSSNKGVPSKYLASIDQRYLNYQITCGKSIKLLRDTAFLIVRKPGGEFKFFGVAFNKRGIGPEAFDLAVSVNVASAAGSFELFADFWSDGIFWRKYVEYAFRHQLFGGQNLEAVEEEQSKSNIQTNRDGRVNGQTWLQQQDAGSSTRSFTTGMHRGGDYESNDLGSVNF